MGAISIASLWYQEYSSLIKVLRELQTDLTYIQQRIVVKADTSVELNKAQESEPNSVGRYGKYY